MNAQMLNESNRLIYRSSSFTENPQENSKPAPISVSSQVNLAPQDFVVLKSSAGQNMAAAYKVSKSNASQPIISPRPPTRPVEDVFNSQQARAELSGRTMEQLIEECIDSRRTLLLQEVEIKRLRRRLAELPPSGASHSATKSATRSKFLRSRMSPLLGSEVDSPRCCEDSPCEIDSGGNDALISNSCSSVISPKNADDLNRVTDSPNEIGDDCTVHSVHTISSLSDLGMPGFSCDPLTRTAPLPMQPSNDSLDDEFVRMSSTGPLKSVAMEISSIEGKTDGDGDTNSGSGNLMRRLGMNASERRKTRIPVTQRLRNLPKHPSVLMDDGVDGLPAAEAVMSKSLARFEWESEAGDRAEHGLLLFMIHDNHMLGATVAASVQGLYAGGLVMATRPPLVVSLPGAARAASGRSSPSGNSGCGMTVMLEMKEDTGSSLFLIGTIIYSGDMTTVKGADGSNPRGAQCMVIGGVQAIRAKLKDFPTRLRPGNSDIKEMDFAGLPAECYAPVDNSDDVRKFLQKVPSRVDVILDPSKSEPNWYPYWEGSRKMAPQFRSKGIGYIRLGDDMSMNGTAFLSIDAGVTFLDDGANSVLDAPKVPVGNPLGSPGGIQHFRMRPSNSMDDDGRPSRPHTPGSPRARPTSSYGGTTTLKNILQSLHNADLPPTNTATIAANLTWAQRVDLLKRLQKELHMLSSNSSTAYTSRTPDGTSVSSAEWVSEAFSIIADSLVKQKNPNVLKESLLCVPLFSPWIPSSSSMELLPSNAPTSASSNLLTWRALFMEVVHCLRHANRNASECARSVLDELEKNHAITFLSIARLNPSPFQELLIGPIRGNSSRPVPSTSSISTAANTVKVTKWLSGLTAAVCRDSAGAALSGGITDDDYYQGSSLFKALKPLLFHREEATREGAVSLMASLVCYDVISAKRPQPPPSKANESPRARSAKRIPAEVASPSQTLSLLPDVTSAGTLQVLREVEEESSKTCIRIVNEALELIQHVKAVSVNDLVVPKPAVQQRRPSQPSSLCLKTAVPSETSLDNPNSTVRFDEAAILDDEWYEAKLALKNPPNDESSWNHMNEIIEKAAGFFSHVNAECSKLSLTSGEFIRAVLPFNESTSSGDQSIVNKTAEIASSVPPGVITKYRPYAVSLRALIRVKMADAEDMKQAKDVTERLKKFCDRAKAVASNKSVPVMSLLQH